jgi:uncharacterized membrane protein
VRGLRRIRTGVAALLLFLAAPAAAQNTVEREVKAAPGKEARVGVYTDIRPDCTAGPLPAIRLVVPPAHGAVNVKRGKLKVTNFKQCLATEVPVFVAFYRATEAYNGTDEFVLEIGLAGGRKELQHFRVQVTNNLGGGQSI